MPTEHVEVVNGPEVERKLAKIAERAALPGPAFVPIMERLQAQEQSLFASYGGMYVQTGALEASLTGGGSGAIRELTPEGLRFGTDVPYARFQGTTGVGNHGGPSAILKLTPEDRAMVGPMVGHYILHGEGI